MEVFLQLHAPSRSDFTCGRMPLACGDALRLLHAAAGRNR